MFLLPIREDLKVPSMANTTLVPLDTVCRGIRIVRSVLYACSALVNDIL